MTASKLEIKKNVLLSHYTTFHIGGVADYFVQVISVEQLKEALLFAAAETNVPPLILGGGSNVLISDAGYRGLVIIISLKGKVYSEVENDKVLLVCMAGEVLDEVIAETGQKNIWGLENLSAIPGSVGATPVQNVGAYGVEVSSLIKSVRAINILTQEEKIFSQAECLFSYRNSFFKTLLGKQWIITEVTFILSHTVSPQLQYADLVELKNKNNLSSLEVRHAVCLIRGNKFPDWNVVGTAGSFFKNPVIPKEQFETLSTLYLGIVGYNQADGMVKVSLGWVLDKVCGLRGYTEGNVSLFEKQALVLVTQKNATAEEVKKFVEKISDMVFLKTNIHIEREVLYI